MFNLLVTVALVAALAFPKLPYNAELAGIQPGMCDNGAVLVQSVYVVPGTPETLLIYVTTRADIVVVVIAVTGDTISAIYAQVGPEVQRFASVDSFLAAIPGGACQLGSAIEKSSL